MTESNAEQLLSTEMKILHPEIRVTSLPTRNGSQSAFICLFMSIFWEKSKYIYLAELGLSCSMRDLVP